MLFFALQSHMNCIPSIIKTLANMLAQYRFHLLENLCEARTDANSTLAWEYVSQRFIDDTFILTDFSNTFSVPSW